MAIPFASDAWIRELSQLLNASEAYEKAGASWEGDFVFIVEPEPGYDQTTFLYLDLYHGKSPSAGLLVKAEEKNAKYILSAPYSTWRKVVEGKLDPIQGLMTKKLKIQGDMLQVMRYPKAAKEIVSCCQKVPTDWS